MTRAGIAGSFAALAVVALLGVASAQESPSAVAGAATAPQAQRIEARITDVTDGDTLRVRAYGARQKHYRVQLIGIDTPETVEPTGDVECGGRQATDAMVRLSFNAARDNDGDGLRDEGVGRGRRVLLVTDPSQDLFDSYGRLLAYVTRSGTDLGARQLRAGWAKVYVYDARFRRYSRFRDAQRQARTAGRGVWGMCDGDFHLPTGQRRPYSLPAPACNPNYSGACLPLAGDVDCPSIRARSFRVVGRDVFRLDGDGDRIACES